MIAVTIGVGEPYAEMAQLAAERVTRHTGLECRTLGDRDWEPVRRDGCSHPAFLKLWVFDLVPDVPDIMFFDADLVFLAPWDPSVFAGRPELVAVRDRWYLLENHARAFAVDARRYFNSGFFIVNRRHHERCFLDARKMARRCPDAPLWEQGPLNRACQKSGIALHFLDRRYNWLGYGNGTLCRRMRVFAAHSMAPEAGKESTLRFLRTSGGQLGREEVDVCESYFGRMGGRGYMYHRVGYDRRPLELRPDGTVGRGSAVAERYWFVCERPGEAPRLAICSEASITCTLEPQDSDLHSWRGKWLVHEGMPVELHEGMDPVLPRPERGRTVLERSLVNLMVPYYGDTLPARQEELDYCIVRNAENPYVARVFLFVEGTPDTSRHANPKVTEVPIGRRMTYEDGFRFANAELKGQLCIIANTDIYFDESLRYLSGLDMERRCFCLSRYDVHADGSAALVGHGGMDAWIFVAPITGVRSDFPLGLLNCDTRIAYELHGAGYAVSNPSRLIAAWHVHMSGKRTASARVPGPSMLVPVTDRL